jgi:hypothetical protein
MEIKGNKKKHVRKTFVDVMTHSELILDLLLQRESIGSNQIFEELMALKQTGLNYKWDTLDAIFYLEKCKIIIKKQDPNHSQRSLIELTDYGKDIAILRNDAIKICALLRKMRDTQRVQLQNVDTKLNNEDRQLENLLKKRQLRLKALRQIQNSKDPYNIKNDLLDDLPRHMILVLIFKYTMILGEMTDNLAGDFVKRIVTALVIELIELICQSTVADTNIQHLKRLSNQLTEKTIKKIAGYISDGVLGFVPIQKEVEELLLSSLLVLRPDKQLIKPYTSYEGMKGIWEIPAPHAFSLDKNELKGFDNPDYRKTDLYWGRSTVHFFQYVFKKMLQT